MSNTGDEVLLNTAHDTDKHYRVGNSVRKNGANTMTKTKRECDTCKWIERNKMKAKGKDPVSLALHEAMEDHQIKFHHGQKN